MKYFIGIFFLLVLNFAQAQEPCISHHVLENQIINAEDPQAALEEVEAFKNSSYIPSKADALYQIPVVFHIIHNGDAIGTNENLSDSLILEQLKRMNIDFSGSNPDYSDIPSAFQAFFADVDIEFCLAKNDPSGNFTSGIMRYDFLETGFDSDSINLSIKPQTIWDRDDYLNIWICNFEGSLAAGLVNGYATPPFASTNVNEDGVVLNYTKVGNDLANNVGRIAIHEIGHWLGLFHIWGDDAGACSGDDAIADTPNQGDAYYNCPSGVPNSCSSDDMHMNYMDYTDASCSLMFTEGQKNKMHSVLNGFRNSILSSTACDGKDIIILENIFPKSTICQDTYISAVKVQNIGTETVLSYGYEFYIDNSMVHMYTVVDSLFPNEVAYVKSSHPIDAPDNLDHNTMYRAVSDAGEYHLNNDYHSSFKAVNTGTGFQTYLAEDFESGSFPPTNVFINNPDGDNTWELFTASSSHFAFIDNFNSSAGKIDALETTDYDFFSFLDVSYELSFDYSHQNRSNFNDTLVVYFSIDCGVNWYPIWSKFGSDLSNNITNSSEFIYTNEAFVTEVIDLCSYENFFCGFKKIRFKFENRSGGGNQLYLDNINIGFKTAIEDNVLSKINMYPNPVEDILNIDNEEQHDIEISIFSITGKQILNKKSQAISNSISLQNISNGFYFVQIKSLLSKDFSIEKILIQH